MVAAAYRWHKRRQALRQKKRQFTLVDVPQPGTNTAKKHKGQYTNFVNQNFESRVLHTEPDVIDIPYDNQPNTTGNSLNTRNRMTVNLRGIKICFHMINLTHEHLTFHFAIVHNRRNNNEPSTTDFYRNDGRIGNERSIPFSAELTGMDHHCLNLNTDKWTVIKHYKFHVHRNANTGTQYNEHMKNFVHFEKYLKLNKQIRFDDLAGATDYSPKLQILHWADSCVSPANATSVNNAYSLGINTITYFRDPKN